jgi:enoyl-CoA hydratase/carnithine racemase
MAGEVRTEVRDGVGWITLSRPEKRNALTVAMWRALPKAVRALADRQDLVALVLQGAEGTFGAGADLTDIVAATESRATATEYCLDVVTALHAVATAPLPTVAVISGVAAGGGAELALACDLRIADPGAKITFPFARMGVVPDQLTLQRLAATVGPSRARRLVLTGETVDAAQALAIGLVDLVSEAGGARAYDANLSRLAPPGISKRPNRDEARPRRRRDDVRPRRSHRPHGRLDGGGRSTSGRASVSGEGLTERR